MIDSHAHLDFKEFNKDREEVIKRFFESSGEKIINVGCDLKSSARSAALAEKYENIFASVGVHPHDADTVNETTLQKFEELVSHQKVVAVGEIGLDYFRSLSPKEKQIEAFKAQLELAENRKKPIIIHCRDAYVELLEILKNYKTAVWRGVTHCFLGSRPIAEELLKLGFYIGFTGAITYSKKSALTAEPEIYKVVKSTPLDKILIETDCPYLAPMPRRGERNEPAFVKYVAEKIAEIKNISAKEVEKATSENARNLFKI